MNADENKQCPAGACRRLLGVDIGGTKCAVTLGRPEGSDITIEDKESFATIDCKGTIDKIISTIRDVLSRNSLTSSGISGIGISCGGPLDDRTGVIMSPPNLPGWDDVHIVDILGREFDVPCALQNDANACALAEWKFGAGKGSRNMAFLTFGTGLGAGLIVDGKLYSGTNGNAGELGHIRLDRFGPVGYGKAGSFEGFCSGGGISQLAKMKVKEKMMMGQTVSWCPDGKLETITAKSVACAMAEGDALAREIFDISSEYLGIGLSILIDIMNPELIVIGSIYARNESMMAPVMQRIIDREALPQSSAVCRVVPAALGEMIGDYAAIAVAATLQQ